MNITERDYAKQICDVAAREIVDENGGALRHWVSCVGYDPTGKFIIVLSNTIQNC